MEPTWTKQIPDRLLCDWYYFLFILNLVVFGMLIISGLFLMTSKAVPKGLVGIQLFMNLVLGVFAGTNTLFYYLICERALKPV
jgi:hypothetical protein